MGGVGGGRGRDVLSDPRRGLSGAAALVACVAGLTPAWAEEPAAAPAPAAPALAAEASPWYWDRGEARGFTAARLDLGAYARAWAAAGYGKPFWTWVGVEAFAITTTEFAAGYAGVRASLPILELQLGARRTWAYQRHFVATRAEHTEATIADGDGAAVAYWNVEADLSGTVPLPGGLGFLVVELAAYAFSGVPDGHDLYDEWLRAVVAAPYAAVARLGYAATFGEDGWIRVGPMAELLYLGERSEADDRLARVGGFLGLAFTDHLDLAMIITLPVSGPDELGAWLGMYGTLGVRYRFATGEPGLTFP